jgi:hypothetical protein
VAFPVTDSNFRVTHGKVIPALIAWKIEDDCHTTELGVGRAIAALDAQGPTKSGLETLLIPIPERPNPCTLLSFRLVEFDDF